MGEQPGVGVRVSFVVPAHNEERLIAGTLESIHAAADEAVGRGRYEVVVADDSSADRTGEIARTFADRGTRVVRAENRQISKTRNTGARAAVGAVLVFVDADTRIDAAVVRAALAALERGAVGGGARVRFDGRIPLWSSVALEVFQLALRLARVAAGCFVFCTREAFERAGGWDESFFAGEEVEFSHALVRQGKFIVVRQRVTTSGRKLRTYSAAELLGLGLKAVFKGKKMLRTRDDLGLWYDPRREDKGAV